MNPFVLSLFRPTLGQAQYKLLKDFVLPLIKMTVKEQKEGQNILLYNAPAVIIFYGTELTDGMDQILAATHVAAESLGLGTFIIGTIPPGLAKNKTL